MPNTDKQQEAIDCIDRNVSVSAGAGSGKTAVLKQRFLNILKQSKNKLEAKKGPFSSNYPFTSYNYGGVKSGNIVGITFTRKAAGEIKSRIRAAMLDAMNEGDVSFWRMQLAELERAQINTIHGLCGRILRDNPVETNLDPSFVIAEDADYETFKEEAILKFIRKRLAAPEENSIKALTDILGASMLRDYLAELAPNMEDIAGEGDLTIAYEDSALAIPECIDALKNKLKYLAEERDTLAVTSKGKPAAAYIYLENIWTNMLKICSDLDSESLESAKKALDFRASGTLKEERDEAREIISELETRFVDRECKSLMEHWQNTLNDFGDFLTEAKSSENMLTYDDLETKAIELLRSNEEIRHKYQKQYQYLMVDEFQDTNDKQCALIYLLCGESDTDLQGNKLFVVGDIKQSIYRFRGADVDVFTQVQEKIKDSKGNNIPLKINFRSKDTILNCCNEIFGRIMGKASSSKDFDTLDCADFNMGYPIVPELISIDPDSVNANQLELIAVAQKILAVAKAEREAQEKKVAEGIEGDGKIYGNMAVLLRAMTHVNDLTQVFTDYNIPFVVIDGKGFYERQEVADLISLFDVLLDHYENIPLAAILRSPYFGFDDELLTKVFLKADYGWDALKAIASGDCLEFTEMQRQQLLFAIEKLKHLASCIAYMDLTEIWTELWKTLDIEAVISSQNNGKQKLANIKKLRKLSLEYIQENNVGLAEWLKYVKNARAMQMRETNANLDAVDAVQIMTIHKSKGLEFSKVFLPFLGARHNSDTRSIVYSKGLGLGLQLVDANGNLTQTSVFKAIKEADKDKEREERQRLLYVAMTRAKDELYMFGIPAKKDKEFDEAKWFDQLWKICEEFGGVSCSKFSDDDIVPNDKDREVENIKIEGEIKKQIAPLPEYQGSGRVLFTASALSDYLYCERQYFYSEVKELPALKENVVDSDNLPSAAVVGDIIHGTLEKYRKGMDLHKLFKELVRLHAPDKNTDDAWKMLENYVESDLYKSIPSKQLHEFGFNTIVDESLEFTGFVDVIAYNDDDTVTIIDYKSGKPPEDGEEKTGYMYQLAIYKYAVEKLLNKKVKSAQLHFLQNCSQVKLTDENVFAKVIALAKEISAKVEEKEFSCKLESCGHCQYNYLCKK